jgi:flavodoxin
MDIAIVYDSRTGTTAKAAQAMSHLLVQAGHNCQVYPAGQAKAAEVAAADLLCIGGWVQGLFIIRQHPSDGAMRFIQRLDDLVGQKAIVFCTYKLAAGSTLLQMAEALEGKGAQVIAQFKYRGPEPNHDFATFAAALA